MSRQSGIIAGAGLGGLCAALCLARKGIRSTVVEQSSEFGEVGAGIQVSPNGTRVLFALGLEDELDRVAFRPEAVEMLGWRRGQLISRLPLGATVASRFGTPYLHLHRADLHRVLAEAATGSELIDFRMGSPLVSASQDERGVVARTRSGEELAGDFLIGADGIRSTVREFVVPHAEPSFTGCVAWRGVIDASAFDGAARNATGMRSVAALWMGPGAHFVNYYLRRGELVNFVAIVERDDWSDESWTVKGDKRDLVDDFAGWHSTVQNIIHRTPHDECYKWALFVRKPLPAWTAGRITLLGDSCHATLPFLAQGACLAFEDAAVLARCLDGYDEVEPALRRYEVLRRDRTAITQAQARKAQTVYHLSDGRKAWLRNIALRLGKRASNRRIEGLYGYDALALDVNGR